jgi:hypothetical protein
LPQTSWNACHEKFKEDLEWFLVAFVLPLLLGLERKPASS